MSRERKYRTPTYVSWEGMHYRCRLSSNSSYKYYGAKGVRVCERWNDYGNFLKDMGDKPAGMSLDRIDTSKGYSPDNCRWATEEEQQNNRSNNNRQVVDGIMMGISQCSRVYNIPRSTLATRMISKGMTLQEAKDEG